jgi:beta-glucosidase
VTVTVKNSGTIDAKEVVQVYVTDILASVVVPNTQLVGFVKVSIGAGQSKKVTVPVRGEEIGVWSSQQKWVVEPGDFLIRVGTSDRTFANTTLTAV